jgi:hypothetical protein
VSEDARVEIWQEPDEFWRWRYRDPGEGVDLLSNESYLTRAEAEHSATTAYPGVPFTDVPPLVSGLGLGRTARRAGLVSLGAAGAAGLSPIVAAMAWRRRRRRRRHQT